MESRFLSLMERKFENLNHDDEQTIFQWASKILYGTLYKELSLKMDVRNPHLGPLLTPEQVENYGAMHLHLQSIRVPTEFIQPKPWSLFVFNYKEDTYDYINEIRKLCFSIKLGEIGVTLVFQDNNEVENVCAPVKGLNNFMLDDLQFIEATALVFYGKYIAENTPTYMNIYCKSTQKMQVVSLRALRSKPWDDQEYAALLEAMLAANGVYLDEPIYLGPGQLQTSLVDDDGVLMIHKLNSKKD
ncbi:hypothetical protein AM218_05820 [Hymenobacter sp. DG25A]|nr:hypothetical protein AM218_05820 [Hymenobacter sp. DG25A]